MVLGFDVAFGCLKSGIGSRLEGNGFWKGCAKGSLGGAVMYIGEHIASYNNYPMTGAAGKLVHDLGVSMSDNVMRGEGMFSQYETDLGPANLTFNDSYIPHISFTLKPAVGIAQSLLNDESFDAKLSLYNLTPVFRREYLQDSNVGGVVLGSTIGNVISYLHISPKVDNRVLSHEMNHALYWSKFRFSKDLVQWVPTEKIHPSLEMEKIQHWWNIGQDIAGNIDSLLLSIDSRTYWYLPPELEAYSMENW